MKKLIIAIAAILILVSCQGVMEPAKTTEELFSKAVSLMLAEDTFVNWNTESSKYFSDDAAFTEYKNEVISISEWSEDGENFISANEYEKSNIADVKSKLDAVIEKAGGWIFDSYQASGTIDDTDVILKIKRGDPADSFYYLFVFDENGKIEHFSNISENRIIENYSDIKYGKEVLVP